MGQIYRCVLDYMKEGPYDGIEEAILLQDMEVEVVGEQGSYYIAIIHDPLAPWPVRYPVPKVCLEPV